MLCAVGLDSRLELTIFSLVRRIARGTIKIPKHLCNLAATKTQTKPNQNVLTLTKRQAMFPVKIHIKPTKTAARRCPDCKSHSFRWVDWVVGFRLGGAVVISHQQWWADLHASAKHRAATTLLLLLLQLQLQFCCVCVSAAVKTEPGVVDGASTQATTKTTTT